MNYIYFGTPSFSARCLKRLLASEIVPIAVVCNPDRPVGRKKILTAPPVKIAAQEWNAAHAHRGNDEKTSGSVAEIQILQPEKLDSDFQNAIRLLAPDFFVVFAYNKIFRADILGIPPLGTIGIHPSLLPQYRGPSPFQTALLDGATATGVTLYFLDAGIDAGPILAKSEAIPIARTDTFSLLAEKLADIGANLLLSILPGWKNGQITPTPQDESQATFTKKFKTEDGFVTAEDLAAAEHGDEKKAREIDRKIRALNPEPGAWTTTNGGKRMKLLAAIIADDRRLVLIETQIEGERAKKSADRSVG